MTIELNQQDIVLLYEKADRSFFNCVNLEENKFLRKEVGVPLNSIERKESYIKFIFKQFDFEVFTIEICLLLFVLDKEIGQYTYYQNQFGESVDDKLVFY